MKINFPTLNLEADLQVFKLHEEMDLYLESNPNLKILLTGDNAQQAHASTQVSEHFFRLREELLNGMMVNRTGSMESYLRERFNMGIAMSTFYPCLNSAAKDVMLAERARHESLMMYQSAEYQMFTRLNQSVEKVTLQYNQKIEKIFMQQKQLPGLSLKQREENMKFMKDWGFDPSVLPELAQSQINLLIQAQIKYSQDLKRISEAHHSNEIELQQALHREATLFFYKASQTAYQVIGQIGADVKSQELQNIEKIGVEAICLALDMAVLSDETPEIIVSKQGMISPFSSLLSPSREMLEKFMERKEKLDVLESIKSRIEALSRMVNQSNYTLHNDIVTSLNSMNTMVQSLTNRRVPQPIENFNNVQTELNRIAPLVTQVVSQINLQEFTGILSSLAQFIDMDLTESNQSAIVSKVVDLRRWLIETANLSGMNGAWCFNPADSLAAHYRMIGNSAHPGLILGYLGKLAELLPNIHFNGVEIDKLPNLELLIKGIETYIKTRLHLKTDKAQQMDPKYVYHRNLLKTVENALTFVRELMGQESSIMTELLNQYRETYLQIISQILPKTKTELQEGHIIGFQPVSINLDASKIKWPETMNSTIPGFSALSFASVLTKIQAEQSDLQLHNLIQKNIDLAQGMIIAEYTPSFTASVASTTENSDFSKRYWTSPRSADYSVKVYYVLNDQKSELYQTTGKFTESIQYDHIQTISISPSEALGADLVWPKNMSSSNPLYATLDCSRVVQAITTQGLKIPGLIQEAMKKQIGSLQAVYTPSFTASKRNTSGDGRVRYYERTGRGTSYAVSVNYVLGDQVHTLYTQLGTYTELAKAGQTLDFKPHKGGHTRMEGVYDGYAKDANDQHREDY